MNAFKYWPDPNVPPSREDRSTNGWISALMALVATSFVIVGPGNQYGLINGLLTGLLAYCLMILIMPLVPRHGWSPFQWVVALFIFIIAIGVRTR